MSVKRFIRWFIVCTVGISLVVLFTIGPAKSASANVKESLSNSIVKKALVSGVRRCYSSGALSPKVEKLSSFTSFGNLITGGNAEDYIALPNGLTNVTDSNVSCKQLFMGYSVGGGSFDGLFKLANRKADELVTVPEKTTLLEGMGYEVNNSDGSSSKKCVNFVYSYTALGVSGETATKSICIDGSNNITVEASQSTNCGGTDSTLACQVPIIFEIRGKTLTMHDHDFVSEGGPITYNGNWDEFIGQVERQLSTNLSNVDDGTVFYSFKRSNPIGDGGQGDTSYILKSNGVNNALQYLSLGLSSQFSNSEKLSYYVSVIKNWFFDGVNIEGGTSTNSYWTCGITDWNAYGSYIKINSNMNGTSGCNCGIDISKASKTANIYGFSGDSFDASGGTTLSLASTVSAINSLVEAAPSDSCEPSEDDENPEETPSVVTDPDDTTSEDSCYGAAGTIGLGWIMCPILSGISNSLNWVYNNIVRDYLVVETGLTSDSQVYDTWRLFQNISNIILVIFLLVVIFSQLTGIGIDNYGIKKILPRLIICAVLINLSYFVVQFLVDISNIVGNSIAGIFDMSSISITESDYTGLDIPSNILGLGVVTTFGVGVAAVVANPAILLSFLLVILSGLISVLLMWIILIARKAGVVIALVIAPIAFAMYLLPNTSKFTKTWGNLIKGLLLLYPLAALLIGASFFASNLIASLGDGFVLPAMLLRVVPFFALPTLFRKSIDAVGNLGTKIQGFGRGLSRAATGAIRGSDAYKTAQERGLERRTRIRAGLDENGKEQTGWRALLRSRNARNRARYRSQYLKTQAEQEKANQLNDANYMDAMQKKQRFEAEEASKDAVRYTDEDYIKGRALQGELSRENEIANARFYNTPGYVGSRQAQYEEGRQSELRKMFTEQNLSRNTTAEERRDRLAALLSGGLKGENDAAEAEALIDLLNSKGDTRQLIDGLNGVSTAELTSMATSSDSAIRNRLSRIAGRAQATGNALLKGWGKSVNKGNSINIDDYISRSGAGGLNNYVTTDAGVGLFNGADKDTLEFLSAHGGANALNYGGAEAALASMATSAANTSPRAATAINNMIKASGVIRNIGSHISAENLAKMSSNDIATTFMTDPDSLKTAIDTLKQPGNERLISSLDNDVRATLGL